MQQSTLHPAANIKLSFWHLSATGLENSFGLSIATFTQRAMKNVSAKFKENSSHCASVTGHETENILIGNIVS